ncbi:MAG: hypothetical protein R2761_30565 [Acidimicrobiales bacterium]
MRHPLRSLAALSLLTLGACGSGAGTEAAGAPESVPFASTATSAAPVTAPPTTAPVAPATEPGDLAAAGGGGSDEINAALITSLLGTEDGRAMVAEMMAQETGITPDQAVCFLENVAPETMMALSQLGASGATPDPSTLPPGALDDLMAAVSTCGISPDTLLG